MKKLKYIIAGLAVLPLAAVLTACGGSTDSQGGEEKTKVKIAVVSADDGERAVFQDVAREKGFDVEYVEFSQYSQPNPALRDKQVDMNWFQTAAYLANYNVNANDDLTIIESTEVVPLGLYSTKYKTTEEFSRGDQIAIPNDEINQARAINVLKTAGLVTLKNSEDKPVPTPLDIDEQESRVKVTPVDASQTIIQKDSVEGFIVNNTFVNKANIDPNSAVFKDDPENPALRQYVNGFTVRAEDKNNEKYKTLASLYHDPRVLGKVREITKGTSVPTRLSREDIDKTLQDYEQTLLNSK